MDRGMLRKRCLKFVFILFVVSILSACGNLGETSNKPWIGFAKNKEENKLSWWFSSYETYDECIEAMEWGVTNTENKVWYSHPVGCGFLSNNYYKALYNNILVADIKYFECLIESKNPELRKMKSKYGPVLEGYKNDCVSNTKHEVIF